MLGVWGQGFDWVRAPEPTLDPWDIEGLDVKDGKVKSNLQITNFNKKGFENRTVTLESITLVFDPKPIKEQPQFVRFLHRWFG